MLILCLGLLRSPAPTITERSIRSTGVLPFLRYHSVGRIYSPDFIHDTLLSLVNIELGTLPWIISQWRKPGAYFSSNCVRLCRTQFPREHFAGKLNRKFISWLIAALHHLLYLLYRWTGWWRRRRWWMWFKESHHPEICGCLHAITFTFIAFRRRSF